MIHALLSVGWPRLTVLMVIVAFDIWALCMWFYELRKGRDASSFFPVMAILYTIVLIWPGHFSFTTGVTLWAALVSYHTTLSLLIPRWIRSRGWYFPMNTRTLVRRGAAPLTPDSARESGRDDG